ncbi:MAG: PAS domain-containing protein, partial [Candidatus Bathyarchaeia archaeon]
MNAKQQVSKGKIRVLMNMLSDPAVLLDKKGCFLMVNDEFENKTGLSWKQIAGKCFLEIENIPAESKAILLENFKKRFQGLPI